MRSTSSARAVSMITGRLRFDAQVAAQRKAALARQHQVEDHEVRAAAVERAAHLGAVGGERDPEAVALEILAEQLADLGVVVDDQDVVGSLHRRGISHPGARRVKHVTPCNSAICRLHRRG